MEKRTILHIYTDSPSFQTIAKIIITYKISKTGKLLQLLSRETDLEPVTRATLGGLQLLRVSQVKEGTLFFSMISDHIWEN